VGCGVAAAKLLLRGDPLDGLGGEGGENGGDPRASLRVLSGRVQLGERGVREELHHVSAARASRRPASAPRPQRAARAAASAHAGVWSGRGKSGAEASIVAIRR
jgi:hypothetical protein